MDRVNNYAGMLINTKQLILSCFVSVSNLQYHLKNATKKTNGQISNALTSEPDAR